MQEHSRRARWITIGGLLTFALYLITLLCLAFPQGLATPIELGIYNISSYTPFITAAQIQHDIGEGDAGLYAGAAEHIAHSPDHWFPKQDERLMKQHSPGFIFLQAALLLLFGFKTPIILDLMLVTVFCWACAFFQLHLLLKNELLKKNLNTRWTWIIPFGLCLSLLFRTFMLRNGVILTETLSTALWINSVLLSLLAAQEKKFLPAALAGITLALAAYIRAQVEIVILILTVYTAILFILCLAFCSPYRQTLLSFLKNPWNKTMFKQWAGFQLRCGPIHLLILTLLIAHALMLPYRLHNYHQKRTFQWINQNYQWSLNWEYDATLLRKGYGYYITGGKTIACHIAPEQCRQIHKTLQQKGDAFYSPKYYERQTFLAFLKHPLAWLRLKTAYLHDYWFDMAYLNPAPRKTVMLLYGFENLLTIFMLLMIALAMMGMLIKLIVQGLPVDLTAFMYLMALFTTQAVMYLFVHFEARYFYQLKMTLWIVSLFLAPIFIMRTYAKSLNLRVVPRP